jgi:DHA3 family multidrug efflux protein-like MFS transporter
MTTGAGARLIGGWYGTGQDRGIALLFSVAGVIGLVVTLLAKRSYSYLKLSESYSGAANVDSAENVAGKNS